MGKDNLDKNLEIHFKINNSNFDLEFESSNYDLSINEVIRATLRPNQLVLDDDYIYIKTNERAYVDASRNMLKINYTRSNHNLG
jgi:hypothetical protein